MVRNKGKIALAVLCFNILTGVTTYAKELTLVVRTQIFGALFI